MRTKNWKVFLRAFAAGLGDRKWVYCYDGDGVAWRNDVDGMDWLYLRGYPRRGWVRVTINKTGMSVRDDNIARGKLLVSGYATSGLRVELTVLEHELLQHVDSCIERVAAGKPKVYREWSAAAEEAEHARRR